MTSLSSLNSSLKSQAMLTRKVDTIPQIMNQMFIIMRFSNGVEERRECEAAGRPEGVGTQGVSNVSLV